jgi:AbrB family looped-hinge helix DNA binding protein
VTTTLLSSKGQVILPKALRTKYGWAPGTRLEVRETAEGVLLTPVGQGPGRPLAEGLAQLRERINYQGPVVSLEAMDAAVLIEAARTHRS